MRPATVFGIFTNLVPSVRVTLVQRNGQRELWERDIKRELKQRRRRRLRKRHLKSEFALLQTSSRLLHPVQFVEG